MMFAPAEVEPPETSIALPLFLLRTLYNAFVTGKGMEANASSAQTVPEEAAFFVPVHTTLIVWGPAARSVFSNSGTCFVTVEA